MRIEASVESLYYASGAVTEVFEVKVLATDPLKEVRTITEAGDEQPWELKGYPNRGTTGICRSGSPTCFEAPRWRCDGMASLRRNWALLFRRRSKYLFV